MLAKVPKAKQKEVPSTSPLPPKEPTKEVKATAQELSLVLKESPGQLQLTQQPQTEGIVTQLLLPQIQVLQVKQSDQLTLKKAQAIFRKPHRNIRPVLKIVKPAANPKPPSLPTTTITLIFLPILPAPSPHPSPFLSRLPLLLQIFQALLHLRNLKILFLDLCESHIIVTQGKVIVDPFVKPVEKDWDFIRAPELVEDTLVDKDHDYASADVWSVANLAVGMLWGVDKKVRNSGQEGAGIKVPPINGLRDGDVLVDALSRCLSFNHRKRLKLQQLIQCFKSALGPCPPPFNSFHDLTSQLSLHLKSPNPHLSPPLQPTLLSPQLQKFSLPIIEQLSKRKLTRFQLLYQATAFQFRSDVFHQRCDKASNLLVVCLGKNGRLFGGFTVEGFAGAGAVFGQYKPAQTVLLSFSNRTVHRLRVKDQALGCANGFGPVFGAADLVIGSLNVNNVCLFPQSYKVDEERRTPDYTAFAGGMSFMLEEYEVYQVKPGN